MERMLGPGGMQQMLGPGGTQQQMLGPGGTQQQMLGPGGMQRHILGPGGIQIISRSAMIFVIFILVLILAAIFGIVFFNYPRQFIKNISGRMNLYKNKL